MRKKKYTFRSLTGSSRVSFTGPLHWIKNMNNLRKRGKEVYNDPNKLIRWANKLRIL